MTPATAGPAGHRTRAELDATLDHIRQAPRDAGVVRLIVQRPAVGERVLLDEGVFTPADGLSGDTWSSRRCSRTDDGSPHPDMQITLMGTRAIGAISENEARWPLAGDQLFVDLDLTYENLPPGTRLRVGDVVFEVTEQLHTGCGKFIERFGVDAMKWVNAPDGRALNLRGIYARVVEGGRVRRGDAITKI